MQPILIIQNEPNEGRGLIATLMAKRNIGQHIVKGSDAPDSELSPNHFRALIVLGGAQSVYETQKYPFLESEIALCRAFIEDDKPIAGFCLGAQLLAVALGGEVVASEHKEIGWHDIMLQDDAKGDALVANHPKTLLSFHFHGDVIRHVPNSTILASSALTKWQLFRHGTKAYGFQYHAELNRSLLEEMCRNNVEYLLQQGMDAEDLIDASQSHLDEFKRHSSIAIERWLDLSS